MKNSNDLLKILDEIPRVRILVVGDVMLDRYWWGRASRFTKYNGVTLLTPNSSEAITAAKIEDYDEKGIDAAAERLLAEVEIDSLLVTLGEDGMKLFRPNDQPVHFPSLARQVFDVTGAGDTVIASLAVALGAIIGHLLGNLDCQHRGGLGGRENRNVDYSD